MSIDHRDIAKRLLELASEEADENTRTPAFLVAAAQVQATLARDEEQAADTAALRDALHARRRRYDDMQLLVAQHIADGLASRETNRWKAALHLSKALDEAHCNVDDLVDSHLSDAGWDPRAAYKSPGCGRGWGAVSEDSETDPWGPKPNITDQIPKEVRQVITECLSDALLASQVTTSAAETARRLAFALKREGVDLAADIEKQIALLTLGRDPEDPPF